MADAAAERLSYAGRLAVLVARSTSSDLRDTGPNTVKMLLEEIERLSGAPDLVMALAKLKDAAEPFHRLDIDGVGDGHRVRPYEWAEVCEPLREALVNAGELLSAELS